MQKSPVSPHAHFSEGGTLWIEFNKDDKRFYICLEENLEDSSWGYVDKTGEMVAHDLEADFLKYLNKFYDE